MGGLLSIRLKLKAESRKAHSGGDPCIDLHEYITAPICWNSALCYQVFPVLLVDGLKRFSVLATPDTSLSSLCNQLNQSIPHL